MDLELRELERRARGGDAEALDALAAARSRAGTLPGAARDLLVDRFPTPREAWLEVVAAAGPGPLVHACRALVARAAPGLAGAASLDGLLAALDRATLEPSADGAADVKKALKGARLARVEDLRLFSLVTVATEGARAVESALEGKLVAARRHATAAAERAELALGAEPARSAARAGALAALLLGPPGGGAAAAPVTTRDLEARLREGSLRLGDVGLAALAGSKAALDYLPPDLRPASPAQLVHWLERLLVFGDLAFARALMAMAGALADLPAPSATAEVPPPELIAHDLHRLEGLEGPGVGLAREAILARQGHASPARAVEAARGAPLSQAELRGAAERALVPWALGPGTRYPTGGPAWLTEREHARRRQDGYLAHVVDDGRTRAPSGGVTKAQLGKLRAAARQAGVDDARLLQLARSAGALDGLEDLRKEFASWLIDHLTSLSAPPPADDPPPAAPAGPTASPAQRDVLRRLLAELGTRGGGPTAHGLPADLARLGKDEADAAIERLRDLLLG